MRWFCEATVEGVEAGVQVTIKCVVEANNMGQAVMLFDDVLSMVREAKVWRTTTIMQL